MHPIWAAHPRTHLSTEYPPPGKFPYCVTGMPFILFLLYLIDLEFLFHDKCNQPLLGYWSELKLTYNATLADCIFPSLPCTIICNGKNREDKRIRRWLNVSA